MTLNKVGNELGYDLLLHILEAFRHDYATLYNFSLVCKQFNTAGSWLLYHRVVISPPFRPVLNLRDRGALVLTEPSQFTSACRPRYAPLVEELEIRGFLSPRPPPLNTFGTTLLDGVRVFCNLRVIALTPKTCHEDVFTQTLPVLKDISTLRNLAVNASCTDAPRAPLTTQIRHLVRLELQDPTRAILGLLPGWLSRLSDTLRELHLKGNCGSITPGVLTGFVLPPLRSRLCALSLGLSYSLTHDHVFNFLNNFPQLEELELRYYWQLKEPTVRLTLPRLRRLTVLYTRTQARREVLGLCKWMRKTLSSSPLEDLRVICDRNDDNVNTGANISFDSIVDHLSKKHVKTLRFLDLRSSYVGVTGLGALLSSCLRLEEFYISAGKGAFTIFEQFCGDLKYLRTAGFELYNVNRNRIRLDHDQVQQLMKKGCPTFRKLIVNGTVWEGQWTTTEADGNVVFTVGICPPTKAPWERG